MNESLVYTAVFGLPFLFGVVQATLESRRLAEERISSNAPFLWALGAGAFGFFALVVNGDVWQTVGYLPGRSARACRTGEPGRCMRNLARSGSTREALGMTQLLRLLLLSMVVLGQTPSRADAGESAPRDAIPVSAGANVCRAIDAAAKRGRVHPAIRAVAASGTRRMGWVVDARGTLFGVDALSFDENSCLLRVDESGAFYFSRWQYESNDHLRVTYASGIAEAIHTYQDTLWDEEARIRILHDPTRSLSLDVSLGRGTGVFVVDGREIRRFSGGCVSAVFWRDGILCSRWHGGLDFVAIDRDEVTTLSPPWPNDTLAFVENWYDGVNEQWRAPIAIILRPEVESESVFYRIPMYQPGTVPDVSLQLQSARVPQ